MAGRPPKRGLDFAGWDVNIFDNEPKIDKLLDAQGCVGFVIYFYLCQRAYGSNGYYYSWCFDDSSTTARKVGGGAGANSVEETVKLCLHVGLFDKELYDRWQILTSRGIQKRYATVAAERTNKSVISEYWLLNEEESRGLVKVALSEPDKTIMHPDNSIMHPDKSNFFDSKVKYSKVKESKDGGLADKPPAGKPPSAKRFVKPTREEVREYCRQRNNGVDADKFFDHYEANGWVQGRGKPIRDWQAAVRTWERNAVGKNTTKPPAAALLAEMVEEEGTA